jgi:hypothetical protein
MEGANALRSASGDDVHLYGSGILIAEGVLSI